MNKYNCTARKNDAINFVSYSKLSIEPFVAEMETFEQPINLEEGYVQIIYPQRRQFIEQFAQSEYDSNIEYNKVYYPFENRKVEFSSFINTTHVLKVETEFYINSEEEQTIQFELITCGAVQIFVNEETQVFYAPFTRNIASKTLVELKLNKGVNKVNVYATELAERDVFFYYELVNKSDVTLDYYILVDGDSEEIARNIEILTSFAFNKDIYDTNDIRLVYDNSLLKGDLKLRVYEDNDLLNPVFRNFDSGSFEKNTVVLKADTNEISLTEVLTEDEGGFNISFEIEGGIHSPVRKILYSINTLEQNVPEMSIDERKEYIKASLLKNSPSNTTKALLLLSKGIVNDETYNSIDKGLEIINKKGDCADFQFVPLMWLYMDYGSLLNKEYQGKLKDAILNFRFWIDEPGNDAMWWFSENHAFLFHISQYLSGYHFKDEVFTVSNKTGAEQYLIGKERIFEWFEIFNKYGFAEWNSTTYLPVDLIGFATLYKVAPDEEIRELAKKGMDTIFKIVDMNIHENLVGCTYGRVYENDLKGLKNGELSLISWILFGKGYINKTNRASVLLTLVDYEYKREEKYLAKNKPTVIYEQGINKVMTYTYKTTNYVMSSAINYRPFKKGHQQHMSHISFSKTELPLWINNPGEEVYSGENRPSFWAGNGTTPQNFQLENVQLLKYDVSQSVVKYIHAYFPTMNFDKYKLTKDKAFAVLNDTYVMFATNNELRLNEKSAVANRELIFAEETGLLVTVLSDTSEFATFDDFINNYNDVKVENNSVVLNANVYEIKNNNLYFNNNLIDYKVNVTF